MSDNRIHFGFAKISRFGEAFWLRKCSKKDGTWSGQVDNHLEVAPYSYGLRIEFDADEVIETMVHGQPQESNS
jgi:hypothetical protein